MSAIERTVYLACLAVGLAGWVVCASLAAKLPPFYLKRPAHHPVVVTVCGGCGAEWYSYEGRAQAITKCPNCPMSEEEFEALKEAMRKRREEDVQ